MTRTAVFVSGRGTNLQALIDACAGDDLPAEIGLVVSDRPQAQGLLRARSAGIETATVERSCHDSRGAFEAELDTVVRRAGCTMICLAGFMRILGAEFVNRWHDRMINIHPSLLPAFPGLDCHARAIEAGVRITGCTVHFVRPGLDDGPIIAQAAVPVLTGDSEKTLAARVLEAEHRIYPLALKLVALGRVEVVGEGVRIRGAGVSGAVLMNPAHG